MRITQINAREIIDSRGQPTVEADVFLENGVMGRASVPSGASTGSREACEQRDRDPHRYAGKGVLHAVDAIKGEINQALHNVSVVDQEQIDSCLCELDGTENKTRLGANAMLAVSLAVARSRAEAEGVPLFLSLHTDNPMVMPIPMMNILNGGVHADNNVDIQEFMIMPIGATDFPSAMRMGVEVFHVLKDVLKKQGMQTLVGDEGGFAPNLSTNRQALDLLSEAVSVAGLTPGKDIAFALDVAASELFKEGFYYLSSEQKKLSSDGFIDYYAELIKDYPIISIEDGLDENDWFGWEQLTRRLGSQIQLVGDDLFVTNPRILAKGIAENTANAVLIKLNQIGTLSETRETMALASQHGYRCVVSHRSGETEDTFIADLAVATGCGQIKTGSLCRTDRLAKYNQLLRINEWMSLPYGVSKSV
jgi:enolase